MVLRTLILALIASLGTGCFVFEELDASKKLLDKPGFAVEGKKAEKAEPPPAPRAEVADSTSKDRKPLGDWWKKARSVTSGESKSELVRCDLRGTTQFMRRPDCLARGGTPR